MSRTAINVSAIIDATKQINAAKTHVSSAKNAFTQTKNSIDGKIKNRSNIGNRLNTVQKKLSNIDTQISKIHSVVESGANLYRTTDNRIESWRDGINNGVGTNSGGLTASVWASQFKDAVGVDELTNTAKEIARKVAEFTEKVKQFVGLSENKEGSAKVAKKRVQADIGEYTESARDVNYAELCGLWYNVLDKKKENPDIPYIDLILDQLPKEDPLRKIQPNQVVAVNYAGLDALVIGDGDTAIVIFAGTDVTSLDDLAADAAIVAGVASVQEVLAKELIDTLSKQYSDIVVTGHSLGGYLATAVTLKNDAVSKCVAFDPPGRYDARLQSLFNGGRVSKITTYEANGSPISDALKVTSGGVNQNLGTVINLNVESENNPLNHGIKQITEALAKRDRRGRHGGGGRRF